MKSFGLLCCFLLMWGAAFMYLGYSSKRDNSSNPGIASIGHSATALLVKSRKLKDKINHLNTVQEEHAGQMVLEDYRPIDPVPSSKATVRPKPIQHGTPLMPYIPKPPPSKPSHGG